MGFRADVWWVKDDAVLHKCTNFASIAALLWVVSTFETTGPNGEVALW